MQYLSDPFRCTLCAVLLLSGLLMGCAEQSPNLESASANSRMIAGSWVLKTRVSGGSAQPAQDRIMRLNLTPRGTFTAYYRGDATQKWIRAGEGGFSYVPPLMTLFWDNGAKVTLLVTEEGPDRIRVHHGRNLAPLKNQDPDEIFVKQKTGRGPTRSPS